jgi:hypothetical protein
MDLLNKLRTGTSGKDCEGAVLSIRVYKISGTLMAEEMSASQEIQPVAIIPTSILQGTTFPTGFPPEVQASCPDNINFHPPIGNVPIEK